MDAVRFADEGGFLVRRILKWALIGLACVIGLPIVLFIALLFFGERPPELRISCPASMQVGRSIQVRADGGDKVTFIDWSTTPLLANFGTEVRPRNDTMRTLGPHGSVDVYAGRAGAIWVVASFHYDNALGGITHVSLTSARSGRYRLRESAPLRSH